MPACLGRVDYLIAADEMMNDCNRVPAPRESAAAGVKVWGRTGSLIFLMDTRIAPAPLMSGMSRRTMPPASIQAITQCVDHWLGKCKGQYEHKSQRHLFELRQGSTVPRGTQPAHTCKPISLLTPHLPRTFVFWPASCEVKALIGPLLAEEERKDARLRHLEQMLSQWNDVFGAPGHGEFSSPAALAAALDEQKRINAALAAELQVARGHGAAAERRCLDLLAQHHRAHAEERSREARRHAKEEARLVETHTAMLRAMAARAQASYGAPAAL